MFVPVHGGLAKLAGKVKRPAVYELKPNETLRDALHFAGGFDPGAAQARVTIHRMLPPSSSDGSGRARVVIAVGADQFVNGEAPEVPMAPGDSVTVHEVTPPRLRTVTVRGNVWVEGEVGHTPGMRLSEAIRLAGGPKPDVYLGRILVTRVREDSSMVQLRSAFRDSTGAVTDDIVLEEEDEVRVFSRSTFRPERYVAVVGAVRKPGRVAYRAGMTVRDAVLLADGLTPDAWLKEAEIARLAEDSTSSALATTIRVPLDSSYLFGRRPGDTYAGPPGLAASPSGSPETELKPYDNLLIMRQPGWDLQRSVAIVGQVRHPGRYSLLTKTDKVSDLIARAGGLTAEAYPAGVQFYRSYTAGRPTGGDPLSPLVANPRPYVTPRGQELAGRDSVRRSVPERVGIDLPRVLRDSTFQDNIVLMGGDSIYVPEFDPVVMVRGAVNSPGAVAFEPGKNLDWYVDRAGGYTQTGDNDRPYVTQPNGEREGVKRRTHPRRPRAPSRAGVGGLCAREGHPRGSELGERRARNGGAGARAADDHHRGRDEVSRASSRAKRGIFRAARSLASLGMTVIAYARTVSASASISTSLLPKSGTIRPRTARSCSSPQPRLAASTSRSTSVLEAGRQRAVLGPQHLGVIGRERALRVEEQLLVQLLARARAGEADLDVAAHLEAGQPDEIGGEIEDPDRLAHVEHEHLAALADRAGLQHELHRLRDGHEVAAHLGVGDRHRAAALDLPQERRHHAAPAAEHVAEPHRHEVPPAGLGDLLDDLLRDPLGRAHDVGGAHGLVGGDEHQVLRPVLRGQLRDVPGAEHVVGDRLADVVLHQRDVLVGRRVEDGVGTVALEDAHASAPGRGCRR